MWYLEILSDETETIIVKGCGLNYDIFHYELMVNQKDYKKVETTIEIYCIVMKKMVK